jgi:hypothetical protein
VSPIRGKPKKSRHHLQSGVPLLSNLEISIIYIVKRGRNPPRLHGRLTNSIYNGCLIQRTLRKGENANSTRRSRQESPYSKGVSRIRRKKYSRSTIERREESLISSTNPSLHVVLKKREGRRTNKIKVVIRYCLLEYIYLSISFYLSTD